MAEDVSSLHTRPSLLFKVRDPQDAAPGRTFVDVYGKLVFGHVVAAAWSTKMRKM